MSAAIFWSPAPVSGGWVFVQGSPVRPRPGRHWLVSRGLHDGEGYGGLIESAIRHDEGLRTRSVVCGPFRYHSVRGEEWSSVFWDRDRWEVAE